METACEYAADIPVCSIQAMIVIVVTFQMLTLCLWNKQRGSIIGSFKERLSNEREQCHSAVIAPVSFPRKSVGSVVPRMLAEHLQGVSYTALGAYADSTK